MNNESLESTKLNQIGRRDRPNYKASYRTGARLSSVTCSLTRREWADRGGPSRDSSEIESNLSTGPRMEIHAEFN